MWQNAGHLADAEKVASMMLTGSIVAWLTVKPLMSKWHTGFDRQTSAHRQPSGPLTGTQYRRNTGAAQIAGDD
jgi:hypothetical protein